MIVIAGGEFWMGCRPDLDPHCLADEKPGHTLNLDTFAIDRLEVSVFRYAACVNAGACSAPLAAPDPNAEEDEDAPPSQASPECNWGRAGFEQHPINCVTWAQAKQYCEWKGQRLPTEAEWEKAARWIDARVYPWGNKPATCRRAVMYDPAESEDVGCGEKGTQLMGNKPLGTSLHGVLNLSGNVREWVHDIYDPLYYRSSPYRNPRGPQPRVVPGAKPFQRVVRGGSYRDKRLKLRASRRDHYVPDRAQPTLGFRCVLPLRKRRGRR